MQRISIKKLIRRNWFIAEDKVDGIVRTVKFKREGQRTDFFVKNGDKFIKHGIYVQWVENEDKTLHDGYWHVKLHDDIKCFGTLERATAEREAAKTIFNDWGNNPNMELVRWTSLEEGQAFPQCGVQRNSPDFWAFIKNYLVNNKIKMTGAEHQQYGVPLIENKGTVYAFILSYDNWGRLMAEAYDPDNENESAYQKWAGERPEGETSWVNPDMEGRRYI